MRRWTAWLLALVLALSLTACGAGPQETAPIQTLPVEERETAPEQGTPETEGQETPEGNGPEQEVSLPEGNGPLEEIPPAEGNDVPEETLPEDGVLLSLPPPQAVSARLIVITRASANASFFFIFSSSIFEIGSALPGLEEQQARPGLCHMDCKHCCLQGYYITSSQKKQVVFSSGTRPDREYRSF